MIWNILCPRCGATLDATSDMLGGKVECGGCARVFVAPKEGVPAPDPRTARYDRDDEWGRDDDDYRPSRSPGTGKATASLVLGILSLTVGTLMLFMCCPMIQTSMGVLAILFGFFGLKTDNRKSAIAGMVMGALASIFSLLAGILIGSFFASMNSIKAPATTPAFKPVPYTQSTKW